MKKQLFLFSVLALLAFGLVEQSYGQSPVRRVRLQATNATVFSPSTFIVAAEGLDGVGGKGTDLLNDKEGSYCDIHFNEVKVGENSVELIGSVVEAANPGNFGAFVKITANSEGMVNFVFQALTSAGAQTGPAGINLTGTVRISTVLPGE